MLGCCVPPRSYHMTIIDAGLSARRLLMAALLAAAPCNEGACVRALHMLAVVLHHLLKATACNTSVNQSFKHKNVTVSSASKSFQLTRCLIPM